MTAPLDYSMANFVLISEAEQVSQYSGHHIRYLIRRSLIKGRKQGGIWIDTAYDSSKETMTLTRGSENYRALVADEPAIRTIADQLDGEIIVVWKGRTYRIR